MTTVLSKSFYGDQDSDGRVTYFRLEELDGKTREVPPGLVGEGDIECNGRFHND